MAEVNNSSNGTLISGSDNADVITNSGSNVTVTGSAGGDTINLDGSKQLIDYSKIGSGSVSDTVIGFDADDSIQTYDDFALNNLTVEGSDIIIGNVASPLENDAVMINSSAGKTINIIADGTLDRVLFPSASAKQKIVGSKDIDRIVNVSDNSTVTAKNAAVDNRGAAVLVIGATAVDKVKNVGDQTTIRTGDGNDVIDNNASYALLESGAGNDSVRTVGSNVTITGDKGNDSIDVDTDENININAGDGDDVVYSDASNVTIDGVGGNDTVRSSGNEVTITGGPGNDYIRIRDDNIKFVPINYYPTLAADIDASASVAALDDTQLAARISQFVATINDDYLQNRVNADGQAVTSDNTALISEEKLKATYGLSSVSNSNVKAAMEANVDNLNELIGNLEIIRLELSAGSIVPSGKITANAVRENDVANGENLLGIYYTMGFDRPDGTNGAITTDYGAVNTATSLSSARSVLSSLITDINEKIRSISLMPVDTQTTPLDSSKIYLNMTSADTGASAALAKIRNIQFAADGSDLYEKYQQFAALASDDTYNVLVYFSDGGSGSAWLPANVSSVVMGSHINLRQPIDIYNFIKAKAFYMTQSDEPDLSQSNYKELGNAIDASAADTKTDYDKYFGNARDLYNHLQATAYRSSFATDGSDLLVMNTDSYNNLLALIEDDDQSKFVETYGSAAALTDVLHDRLLQSTLSSDEGSDDTAVANTVPGSNVNLVVNAGDGNDSIDIVFNDGKLVGDADNVVKFVTITGGRGNDTVNFVSGTNRLYKYTTGDGADVITGANSTDLIQIDGAFLTVASGDDMVVKVGAGTITLKDAAASGVSVLGYTADGVVLFSGMEYNAKRPKVLVIQDPFTGSVDAGSISDKITIIDATLSSQPVVLKGGNQATAIYAGTGESTLIGNTKDDKLYGGKGVNTFVYNVDKSKDAVFNYEAQDIVSLEGVTFDDITFTDQKNALTLTFANDNKSKLTINKLKPGDAVTFDIGGETFKRGVLPTGVTYDDDTKKTAIKVGATAADGVVVKAAEIASTAKTLNGREASGAVNFVGNANPNVLYAGDYGSTLYGSHTDKAYNDKMYGGAGADGFVYAAGDGNDVIYNFSGSQGDYVLLKGVDSIDATKNVNVTAAKITVTIDRQKLTLDNYDGEVRLINEDGTELYKTGVNLPEGVSYADNKKTILAVGMNAELDENATIDADEISPLIKEMKVDGYDKPIALVGNSIANVIRAGDAGSTLYGGKGDSKKPSADKLHGSTGNAADVFVYAVGDGADVIYNFDGNQGDYVVVAGGSADDFSSDTVKWSGNKLVAMLEKQKLTLEDPRNVVRFVDENGNELYRTGVAFPNGIGYNAGKSVVTLDSSATGLDMVDLNDGFAASVKEVNANEYTGAIHISGNGNANILRAGSGGSTLDGNYDSTKKKATADKLHGGEGADVFIWDAVYGGNDQIFGYDVSKDTISITGAADTLKIDNANFKVSGAKVVMTVGANKLTVNDLLDSHQLNIAYGDGKTFSFASLPSGIGYALNYKAMTVAGEFAGAFTTDEYDYLGTVVTIDATDNVNELDITGNKKAKVLVGGAGITTMRGTTGNDTFVCGEGADVIVHNLGDGKDIVNGFDSDTDVVKVVGNTSPLSAASFTEKNNDVILNVGTGSITFKDAPRGTLTVEYDGGTVRYKTLPLNTTYVAKKSALTLTKFFDADGLDANNLDVTVNEINATAVASKAVDLQASSENTRMMLGKGGGTLRGGSGNDTMIGNTGEDVFVAGVGDDVIDKFTFKNDKVVINSALTDSTLKGSKDVEIKTADGSVWIKNVLNQEFTIINNGVEQKYKFTRTAKTLEEALVSGGDSSTEGGSTAEEIAVGAEDYWFMQSETSIDELTEIAAPIDACVLDEPTVFASPLKNMYLGATDAPIHSGRRPTK